MALAMELRALPLRPCENEALLKAGEFSKTVVNAAESWVTTANIVLSRIKFARNQFASQRTDVADAAAGLGLSLLGEDLLTGTRAVPTRGFHPRLTLRAAWRKQDVHKPGISLDRARSRVLR